MPTPQSLGEGEGDLDAGGPATHHRYRGRDARRGCALDECRESPFQQVDRPDRHHVLMAKPSPRIPRRGARVERQDVPGDLAATGGDESATVGVERTHPVTNEGDLRPRGERGGVYHRLASRMSPGENPRDHSRVKNL